MYARSTHTHTSHNIGMCVNRPKKSQNFSEKLPKIEIFLNVVSYFLLYCYFFESEFW